MFTLVSFSQIGGRNFRILWGGGVTKYQTDWSAFSLRASYCYRVPLLTYAYNLQSCNQLEFSSY
jgi:hypothetical protein